MPELCEQELRLRCLTLAVQLQDCISWDVQDEDNEEESRLVTLAKNFEHYIQGSKAKTVPCKTDI